MASRPEVSSFKKYFTLPAKFFIKLFSRKGKVEKWAKPKKYVYKKPPYRIPKARLQPSLIEQH